MKIAIDGPAGVGKSTIAKLLAKEFNLIYINTGAMYRGLAYFLLKNPNLDMENIKMEFEGDRLIVNGEDVSDKIFNERIDKMSSKVSKDFKVRKVLTQIQKNMAENYNRIVMEGRDIGTVVMPNADYKFFLTASADERAKRRFEQEKNKGMKDLNLQEIKKAIIQRDRDDTTRKNAPLKKADDAIEIDTTNLSIQEVIAKISYYISGGKDEH